MFSGFFLYARDTPQIFRKLFDLSIVRRGFEAIVISLIGFDRKPFACYDVSTNSYILSSIQVSPMARLLLSWQITSLFARMLEFSTPSSYLFFSTYGAEILTNFFVMKMNHSAKCQKKNP